MAVLIDGKKISLDIEKEIAKEVEALTANGERAPHLAAILVGNDGPSRTYVRSKIKACEMVGFESSLIKLEEDVSEERLIEEIIRLNESPEVDGYIVQLPLPEHISVERITDFIQHKKDVDGFTPTNFGKIDQEHHSHLPATPMGVMELLKRYKIETKGKHCVVVGKSHIVGMPMGILLAGPGDATVTICHIFTENLKQYTLMADILVVAVGKHNLITADMVKDGVVVVDVGINRVPDATKKKGYALRGDVDFKNIEPKASYITPVPGGVGPMTIASLIMNTLEAYKISRKSSQTVS
jgi:methylenetetrahydrofolate dehydrogenase (NADP+)/methenyltetrahydrofolate cyclohydrolase